MKINSKIDIGIISFYIFWIILLVGKGMGYTSAHSVFIKMTWYAIAFAAVKLLCTRWTQRQLIISIFLVLLGLGVWLSSGEVDVLLTIIVIISLKNINIYQMLKISFWIKGGIFVVRTTLAILGYIDSQLFLNTRSTLTIRYGLGYGHPNTAHYTLFVILTLCILCYRDKLKLWHYICLMAYNLFIFKYTSSNTGLAMSTLLIFCCYIFTRSFLKPIKQSVEWFVDKSFVFCAILSILICYLFSYVDFLRGLGTLTSRFSTAVRVITNNSLSLFGVKDITTDFGYINILYGNGIIVFILFIVMLTTATRLFKKSGLIYEEIVFFCYAIYTLSESYSMSILMNVSLVYLSVFIYFPLKDEILKISIKNHSVSSYKTNKTDVGATKYEQKKYQS